MRSAVGRLCSGVYLPDWCSSIIALGWSTVRLTNLVTAILKPPTILPIAGGWHSLPMAKAGITTIMLINILPVTG